jgi:hypothetical protein
MRKLRNIIAIAFLILCAATVSAQEEAVSQPSTLKPVLTKRGDGSRILTAYLTSEGEKEISAISNTEIVLSITGADGDTELGRSITDEEGYAEIILPATTKLSKDEEGYFNFTVTFEGNDKYDAASESLRMKDFVIKLDAHMIDSVRMLFVDAYSIEADGSQVPFDEGEIGIYVQGMFSRLPLEPVWMEKGHGEIEFPADVIGDPMGKVKIFAAVMEHEEFGNVEDGLMRIWGLGYRHANQIGRELWTSEAPWWMVIALAIMIAGVWGHYVFAMTQLARIKRVGREELNGESIE